MEDKREKFFAEFCKITGLTLSELEAKLRKLPPLSPFCVRQFYEEFNRFPHEGDIFEMAEIGFRNHVLNLRKVLRAEKKNSETK